MKKIINFKHLFIPLCLSLRSVFWMLLTWAAAASLHAAPQGGQVTAGEGTINITGRTTSIEQLSDLLAIRWSEFNLSATERVDFLQANAQSIVLNQIMQMSPSQIDGTINANGHVILVNPRGIVFGENSIVNAGSLTASSLWIDKDDFLNGDFLFTDIDDQTQGRVINYGLIAASSGGVTLLGEQVKNEGLIQAKLGYVNLSAGKQAYLTFDEAGFLGVAITEELVDNELGLDVAVENKGIIQAQGGRVALSAKVSENLFDTAVSHKGIIQATGFGTDVAGFVELEGDSVVQSGAIDISSAEGQGGTAHILGDHVKLEGSAEVNANGFSGGGEVLIGGDYQGKNTEVRNALTSHVTEDVSITADATDQGDGGKVIIWSDGATQFKGHISATGGATSGDGGFAEVSGKYLGFNGTVDLQSPNGDGGTLLLDPDEIVISADGTDDNELADAEILFADGGAFSTFNISTGEIETQLNAETMLYCKLMTLSRFKRVTLLPQQAREI